MPEPPGPTPMGGVSGITWTPAAAQGPTSPTPSLSLDTRIFSGAVVPPKSSYFNYALKKTNML